MNERVGFIHRLALLLGVIALGFAGPATAQQTAPSPPRQVISANPFGLLIGWFNAEYERTVSSSATAGVGGSFFPNDDEDYVNADVFYRFYPSGKPHEGWTFGVKAGVTSVTDAGTFFGVGIDTNWSWLLGERDNFYVGVGFGLKRLFGAGDSGIHLEFVPTIRVINIGFAF